MSGLLYLSLMQGLREYASEPHYDSERATELADKMFDVLEGQLSFENLIRTEEDRATVSHGLIHLESEHGVPREVTDQIHESLPEGRVEVSKYSGFQDVRQDAIVRDQARCQRCGITQKEHIDSHGRGLDVHHITPVRQFYDPRDAHELRNLVTLCRSCHRKEEASL